MNILYSFSTAFLLWIWINYDFLFIKECAKFISKVESISMKIRGEVVKCLEKIKKTYLFVDRFIFWVNSAKEFEDITNPSLYYSTKINFIFELCSRIKISDKTFENLQLINPISIYLNLCYFDRDETKYQTSLDCFVDHLLKLDDTSLIMNLEGGRGLKLDFNGIIWKVIKTKNEYSYIRAKSLSVEFRSEEINSIKQVFQFKNKILISFNLFVNIII